MRGLILLLVLLLSMCGAQTQSTQTEVQTESQSTGATAVNEVTTQLDVSTELRELRDMVVELRVLLTVTQNELHTIRAELTATNERLVASETKVEALERVNSAQYAEQEAVKKDLTAVMTRQVAIETDMEHVKIDNTAQHTDLTTMKTEVMDLIKENSTQHTEITVMKTTLDTVNAEIENLKLENAAQDAELTAVKARLADTETDVMNLEKEATEKPKVAFSAALTNSDGTVVESGNTELNLVFAEIITDVGEAYSSITGFFTAPVKGVYYFRFTVTDGSSDRSLNMKMFKNGDQIMLLSHRDVTTNHSYLSGGVTLQLEMGDLVNLRLPPGHSLWDTTDHHCTFSGFLLFPL